MKFNGIKNISPIKYDRGLFYEVKIIRFLKNQRDSD